MTQHATAELARKVNEVAWRNLTLGPKAFICDVHANLCPRLSLTTFKFLLIDAHRKGLIELSRCDLSIDPTKAQQSEIRYLNATFHFVTVRKP